MPGTHARLSASSAHRWLECPGSVKLSELYPDGGGTSIYAEEGTLAHSMAEAMIGESDDKQTAAIADATKFYVKHSELNGSANEMRTTLESYVDYVRMLFEEARKEDPAAVLMTEQRVDFNEYVPGGFGTSDVILIYADTIHIVDLKYGKGVRVDAEDNPQLKLYALGALDRFDVIYDVGKVITTIYQPRLDHVSTAAYAAEDLKIWGGDIVGPLAREAAKKGGSDVFNAGDHCKFCPARFECQERASYNMQMERYMHTRTLSADDIAYIISCVDDLIAFAEDIKAKALERALNGEEVKGFKVVEGRSIRKYSVPDKDIVSRCKAAGYKEAVLYEKKLLTITAMEKLLGKKEFAEVLGDCVEKPAGKPTLVPLSDKREAITGSSAIDDFAGE